ncbi:gliding motility-associated C-terminal domain-containing protein [Marixanthomonas sp. SCSIO 43207]|uniref:Ig-like domain-containing protein n=1 Tax=Marixanthomonas sp. SCSIO 43207 TaxID=2779360 RepID=UPI001CA9C65B|nr:gliding motility-associated C-terminal domain-containing protein [Marixanthomonas sp. SCSIO 43207]UAB80948.1 gliding motility-associated C-terminal domain-containing protein [Marixanthomonas sp. SCSIO 43207]
MDNTSYYGAQIIDGCESEGRLEVEVTIGDAPTPTTNNTEQDFCVVDNPTVADIQVNETNVTWYDQPTEGTPYNSTDPLSDNTTYYASLTDATSGCESSVRLAVLVNVGDAPTPTTDNTEQDFCVVDNPTIADIQVNETNVTWYDQPTGGTPYNSTDPLSDNTTYYASLTDANSGCESSVRLAVLVNVGDAPTPTTNNTEQDFCVIDNPTVADIQVNETNVTWYDQPTEGTPYNSTDPLSDNTTYYASLTDATSGCESSVRLAVLVNVGDAPTPTTDNTEQDFCVVDNPTVADIQVNETNVTWYDQPTEGTPYNSTDPLSDNTTYYASLTDATSGCESSVRLAVLVTLSVPADPIITSNATGEVCLETLVTYSTEPGNQNYIWTATGGNILDGGGTTDNTVSILWTEMENTSVSVSYESNTSCGTGNTTTFEEIVMVCADLTINKTVDNKQPTIGEIITFTIAVTNEGPNDFMDVQISEDMPSGFELVDFTTSLGTYNPVTSIWQIDVLPANVTATLEIRSEVLGEGNHTNVASIVTSTPTDMGVLNNSSEIEIEPLCLIVYNEFSPNGDGVNDQFVISCIENFPNNTLQIFNRYGSLVFKANQYSNEWDGRANVSGITNTGDVLPAGTYFYILEMDNASSKSGWVYLAK